jgi:hypothetical protein
MVTKKLKKQNKKKSYKFIKNGGGVLSRVVLPKAVPPADFVPNLPHALVKSKKVLEAITSLKQMKRKSSNIKRTSNYMTPKGDNLRKLLENKTPLSMRTSSLEASKIPIIKYANPTKSNIVSIKARIVALQPKLKPNPVQKVRTDMELKRNAWYISQKKGPDPLFPSPGKVPGKFKPGATAIYATHYMKKVPKTK